MMGLKERAFGPLPLTLEDLVPLDHFYRHLERSLDLIFVRDRVRDRYAPGGRPSVDPVVFFKLQLVSFLRAFALNVNSCRWSPTGSVCAGTSATTLMSHY